jgi:hypothetical protein
MYICYIYNIYVSLSPCCSIIDSQTLYWVMSPKGETAETALAQYSHFMRQDPSFQAFYLGLPRNRVEPRIAIQKENKSGWEPLDFGVPDVLIHISCRSSQYEYLFHKWAVFKTLCRPSNTGPTYNHQQRRRLLNTAQANRTSIIVSSKYVQNSG